MAKARTTEKDHNNGQQVPVMTGTYAGYSTALQLLQKVDNTTIQMPTAADYNTVVNGLARFEANGARFQSENPEDHVVLKQHLAFTLFVPAGKADRARTAVELLDGIGIFRAGGVGKTTWRKAALAVRPHVRFYATKMQRLQAALKQWPEICEHAEERMCCRNWIRHTVSGFGDKATAHFMRNVGLSVDPGALPIIDVHIHKALEAFNFQHDTYKQAETSFRALARLSGVPVLRLDACLWCAYAHNWDLSGADFDNFGIGVK